MSASLIKKTEKITREHGAATVVSVAGLGQEIRIPLKRDTLIAELMLAVSVSQVFAVAPTASDIRRMFKTISLESGDGEHFVNLPFHVVYDLGRFTEAASAPVAVNSTPSTLVGNVDIHFEADDTLYDLFSAFRTKGLSDLTLVLTQADDAAGCFTGGTTPAAQTTSVVVTAVEYPDMADDNVYGSLRQIIRSESTAVETSTGDKIIKLRGKNASRFIIIHAFDTSGAVPVPSDAFVGLITLQDGDRLKKRVRGSVVKNENITARGFNVVGCYVIDQGEHSSFLDFSASADIDLSINVLSATSHKFIVSQSMFVPNANQLIEG